MLKQIPLHALHLELGAKMVAFSGYQMPIQYWDGIVREHLHCRSQAGFFDISHMGQCMVSGDGVADELERLTPSDITGLKSGQQKYTVLTNSDGGSIDDIIITRIGSGLVLVVNAACKEKDFQYLSNRLSDRCQLIELTEQALFALQGPSAATIMRKFSAMASNLPFMQACETGLGGIQCTVSRSGYTGEDGFEISVAASHAEALARLLLSENDVAPIGLGARDTLRLEAGLCLYGHELNETITPVEAGLSWLIKKGHTDFPGADKIIQQLQQGPEKIRVGLSIDSKQPVRQGSVIINDNDDIIGHVTSGSYAPSLGRPVAMALLNRSHAAIGTRLYASVRGQQIPATVTPLPFVPHRYQR
ncbi:Aminomethyltransferase [Crenothrix polyspora]|uniref:aminomethyltransferase n=1 Tax=Crenothrix polyspora TaxID=360316 RepID=A0A1R4H278_9GAMM|nr:glycine cleavage system aminomethyltransferase GcvT [Crenothrix polyspora]SJM90305.1 Aminomethyltransferase [Crenothrix polyspora]